MALKLHPVSEAGTTEYGGTFLGRLAFHAAKMEVMAVARENQISTLDLQAEPLATSSLTNLSFVSYLTGIVVVLYWLVLGFKFFRAQRNHYYRLTTHRLFLTTGLFQRRIDQVELVRVKDLFVRQSLIGSWLNFGTVILISSEPTLPKAHLLGIEEPGVCWTSSGCILGWNATDGRLR